MTGEIQLELRQSILFDDGSQQGIELTVREFRPLVGVNERHWELPSPARSGTENVGDRDRRTQSHSCGKPDLQHIKPISLFSIPHIYRSSFFTDRSKSESFRPPMN